MYRVLTIRFQLSHFLSAITSAKHDSSRNDSLKMSHSRIVIIMIPAFGDVAFYIKYLPYLVITKGCLRILALCMKGKYSIELCLIISLTMFSGTIQISIKILKMYQS